MRSAMRRTDLVARLGGDEFAVIHRLGGDGLDKIAGRLVAMMRPPSPLRLIGIAVRA